MSSTSNNNNDTYIPQSYFPVQGLIFRSLVKVPFYILAAALSVLQLKGVLSFLANVAANTAGKNAVGDFVRPIVITFMQLMREAVGKKPNEWEKTTFEFSDLLLIAILFALLGVAAAINDNTQAHLAAVNRQTRTLLLQQQNNQNKASNNSANNTDNEKSQ